MLFLTLILGLLSDDRESILLPPDTILKINLMARTEQALFIYDNETPAIWKCSFEGELLRKYDKKGWGPNEFQAIGGLRIYSRKLYAADIFKRVLHVFDLNLKPLAETKVDGLIRDILIFEDKKYLVMWLSKNKDMVQVYDGDFRHLNSFGTALSDPRVMGLQAGRIYSVGKWIVFSHGFLPFFEVFSPQGQLIKKIRIPGFSNEPLITHEMTTAAKTKKGRWDVAEIAVNEQALLFEMVDYRGKKQWLFQYDWSTGKFSKRATEFWNFHKEDSRGFLYRVEKNDLGEPYKLIRATPF